MYCTPNGVDVLKMTFPDCYVNLDYGGAFDSLSTFLTAHGVKNIVCHFDALDSVIRIKGMMADTITLLDDGTRNFEDDIIRAKNIAPLAKRILIIHQMRGGNNDVSTTYSIRADWGQRQRQVYVC